MKLYLYRVNGEWRLEDPPRHVRYVYRKGKWEYEQIRRVIWVYKR